MAQLPIYIGEVLQDTLLQFPVDWIDDSWEPEAYEVFDNDTMEHASGFTERTDFQTVTDSEENERMKWISFPISEVFTQGKRYTIKIKSALGSMPTDGEAFLLVFQVAFAKPQVPKFLGDIRKGDTLRVPVLWPDQSAVIWYRAYEIIDNETMDIIPGSLFRSDFEEPTDTNEMKWLVVSITDQYDTDGNLIFAWREGRRYTIRFRKAIEYEIILNSDALFVFRIEPTADKQTFIGTVEKGKNLHFYHKEENRSAMWYDLIDPETNVLLLADVSMDGPMSIPGGGRYFRGEIETEGTDDLVIGRTYWIRVKDEQGETPNLDSIYSFTVFPRLEAELRRLLALSGENMIIDNFDYDQSGNIIALRVRLFTNPEDAANATQGVTDPEPGEIASYIIDQEHNIPRNVRTFHRSVLEFIASDWPSAE